MKKIISILLTLTFLLRLTVGIPASAAQSEDLYVAGVKVTEQNAADVLGDGTVSYDAQTKTLTLNNATITDYMTEEINGEDAYYGIYSTVDGLTINLVGENKMAIKDYKENDTASAIYSTKPLTISGEGSIDIKCWSGVTCMDDLTVKNCRMSFSTIGLTGMKDVTVEGATLSADYALIMAPNGDISFKNTTVTEGGVGLTLFTELGTVSVEDSSITASSEESVFVLQDKLTIKNTALDLSSEGAMTIMCGQLDLDGVTGSIEMTCEAGYAIMATDVRMKNCELDIEVIATKDSAIAVFSEQDVKLENCSLKIDSRGGKDVAIGIGTLGGDIKADNCTLDIAAKNQGAFALYGSNVSLTDCALTASVTAIATEGTFGAGIFAENGTVKIIGGVVDITVSGPVLESPQISAGINMTNTLLNPELVDVNLTIKAPVVMTSAPYLTLYGRDYEITVSKDYYGDSPVEYKTDDILTYKYFHIQGFYTVSFLANGGTGDMSVIGNLSGAFTLPENAFTAPEGKQFKGWAYTADGEGIPGTSIDVQKDITLYAIWEDIPGGEGNDDPAITPDPTPGEGDSEHTHSYSAQWTQTAEEHYKECACGAKQYQSAHVDSNDNGSCDVCGALYTENSGDGGLSTGAIVGIVIGAVLVIGIGGFGVFWFVIKKKNVADLVGLFKK